ncbi:MAG: LanC-like protein [Burkholderiales bacterium]|nr:LanC-like protein [Burkholderiales bacterium]
MNQPRGHGRMPDIALFEPERHEALGGAPWSEERARAAIGAIVEGVVRERLPGSAWPRWPLHPLDADGDAPRTGFKGLYLGSAGVLWALACLQREGAVPQALDAAAGIEQAAAAYLDEPDTGAVLPSYFLGEAGVQLVRWRLTGAPDAQERLFASIRSNIANPTNEALWGAPGTMVAAWHLWQATGQERWRRLFLDNVDEVWRTWLPDEKAGCHLWTQDLYGKVVQYFGAGHGFAGNAYPLLKGAALLDDERREILYERCVTMLRMTAKRAGREDGELGGDGAVNWPAGTFTPRAGSTSMLMQWCHGAPGFITALADFPAGRSAEFDDLLVRAGRAVWRAGPLAKGHGLCHGTAGNGYAFLKLFRRTGDALWLERARAFAMHAVMQCERMRQQYGHGRNTLWTGDPGLAIFLWHCHTGTAEMPALDFV